VEEYFIEEGMNEPVIESIEKFNKKGDLVELQVFNKRGDYKTWEKYVYNDNGDVVEQVFLDQKGRIIETEKTIYSGKLKTEKNRKCHISTTKETSIRGKCISMNITNEIEGILSDFNSITLKEVQKASLMRRKDSKFMFSCVHVPSLLSMVQEHYRVLEIDGLRSHEYQTMYYDTPDLEMYHMHHRGMANRHKVRFRKYGTSDIHFLEVKKKNSKGVTIKNRIKTNGMDDTILTSEEEFLSTYSPYAGNGYRKCHIF